MSSTDCIDICDLVVSIMCKPCPNYKKCQNSEDDANHDQMEYCLTNGVLSTPADTKHGQWQTEYYPMEDDDE